MESSTAVLGFQRCTCPCKHSASPHPGRVDYARQRVESNSFAGSRQELGAPLNLKLPRRRLPTTRCLYSPLVESFESSSVRPFITKRDGNDGGSMLVSSTSLSFLKSAVVETRSEQDIVHQDVHQESSHRDGSEQGSAGDDSFPAPQDPVAAAHGDSSFLTTASGGSSYSDFTADAGCNVNTRRSARYQPQTMSLTQGFRAVNQGVNCVIGVAGRPIVNASRIGGPAGLMMGLAVAGLGIATAIQKAAETQPQQKLCTRCDGYGVECCDVCCGAGQIAWEGKVHRKNTCPRCFGSRLKKCPRCDGCRAKKESTPVLQMLKTPPKTPPKKK